MSKFIEPATAADYRELARRRLPRQIFDYLDGGSYQEWTRFNNESAFAAIRLRQRVLTDVSSIDLSCQRAGQPFALPIALGPVGLAGLMARRGEVQAHRAAASKGISFCASTVSLCSVEEIARAHPQRPPWFQLYLMKDRDYVKRLLQRASDCGVETLVVTVDLARLGSRYRDIRNGFDGPQSLAKRWARIKDIVSHPGWVWDVAVKGKPLVFGNLSEAVPDASSLPDFKQWVDGQFDASVNWQTLGWLRQQWQGRLFIKGVMDADDAKRAVACDVDGIIVSNHGGRQLDSVAPSITKLAEIRKVVDEQTKTPPEIWLDGGVRSGLDVAKAMALGADGCLLGRAWAFALAARGERGVRELLERLENELTVAMALMGVTRLSELGTDNLDSWEHNL